MGNGNKDVLIHQSEKPDESSGFTSIQEIFNKCGYGAYTFKYIIVTYCAIMCYGLHLSLYAVARIPMNKAYNLTDLEQKFCSAIVFLGLAIGSFVLSIIKDAQKHRKMILVIFSSVMTAFHLLTALVFNPIVLIISRFFIGACIGVTLPGSYSLMVEHFPVKIRSFVLGIVWTAYTIARFALLIVMLIVMPNLEEDQTQTVMLVMIVIPAIALILSLLLVNDSPRNLIIHGKDDEAFKVLEGMIGRDLSFNEKQNIVNDVHQGINKDMEGTIKDMFSSKLLRSSVCVIVIWSLHGLIFYGTLLTSTSTIKDIGGTDPKSNHDIIIDHCIIASQLIPPMVVVAILTEVKIFGRTKSYLLTYIIGAIFMLLAPLIPSQFALLYGLSSSFMGSGNNLSNSYASELYPTKVRNVALSFLYFTSRIATSISQILFLWIYDIGGMFFPYYMSSGLMLLLIGAILLLPFETHSKALDEDLSKNVESKANEI
jgi:putative MFS transporter